jgi:NTE family protein
MTDGDNVLVDGAVMKNFPADIMRSTHLGPIIGVDVTRGRSIMAADIARPDTVWRWLVSGDWRKGPPIVSLLLRAATVSTARDLAASRDASDVLVLPRMDNVEIRNWDAFDPAVEAGRLATEQALSKLSRPVIDLRRRARLADDGPVARISVSPG